MKKLLKALFILIGMMAMLFVIAVIVNLSVFDEELLPEVQAIKDIKAKPYQADNAYPALIALSYYPESSYQSATQKIRQQLNDNITEQGYDYLNHQDEEQLEKHKLDAQQLRKLTRCHTRKEKNCVTKYVTNLSNQPITNPHSQIILGRYRALIEYPNYQEATQLTFDSPIPAYSPLLSTQRVLLLNEWLHNRTDFISLLSKDLAFWRMILKNNNLLITKMIAIAAIHNDIQILAYDIQSGNLNKNQLLNFQRHISSLNQQELDFQKIIEFEMKYAMSTFYSALNESSDVFDRWFYQPLYQPQATINQYYLANIKLTKELNNLDSPAFYDAYQADEWPYKPEFKSPISLYNPSGKLLIKYSVGNYRDYFARVHDLNAMLVLLKLRIELALNNDQNISTLINKSAYKNPYTLKPFDYDAEANTIGFDCLDKTSVCEITL